MRDETDTSACDNGMRIVFPEDAVSSDSVRYCFIWIEQRPV